MFEKQLVLVNFSIQADLPQMTNPQHAYYSSPLQHHIQKMRDIHDGREVSNLERRNTKKHTVIRRN